MVHPECGCGFDNLLLNFHIFLKCKHKKRVVDIMKDKHKNERLNKDFLNHRAHEMQSLAFFVCIVEELSRFPASFEFEF